MPVTPEENKRCKRNQGMTDAIRFKFRDMHNIRRSNLANGTELTANNQKMLRSSNMMRLRWNSDLEAAALQHAKKCTFAKSDETTRPEDGENQATIPHASNYYDAAVLMAWAHTRKLGRAVVKCGGRYNVVCHYNPKQ
ncbi:SCP-like protein [Ancylostoma duodenale]|uniref:SCP-like protein n=1 Tax=Ancylostoma duodenale TaxID=51022 RepID=A0A0C2H0T6_9BILA|nr:SCP-like protein [Ancylostoma duodenale]